MRVALAAAPMLVVLVLMLGLRWSAARAGLAAAAVTVTIAVSAFGFGDDADPYRAVPGLLGVVGESAFIALLIAAIVGPALGIHHLQQRSGATDRLQVALGQLTTDPRIAALLIAWFFSLFMEGAAGFGTPVVLAAPFLVAAGFRPVTAVVAALIGHAVGVSFGAIGTPIAAQSAISGISGTELARATATFHLALGWVLVVALILVIGGSERSLGALWWWGTLAAVSFFIPYGLLAYFVGPELPALGGALIGSLVFVAVLRRLESRSTATSECAEIPATTSAEMSLVRAAAPYLTLVTLVLATRLIPAIRDWLSAVSLEWQTETGFSGAVLPLAHPGILLTLSFCVGVVAQRVPPRTVVDVIRIATVQLGSVFVALLAMVAIARMMSHAGMITELAESASFTGRGWPILSPAVGALGTFMTGSATASNILFTELQYDTAMVEGLSTKTMLGAQGFGAAIGNIIAPYNIVAAAAVVGLTDREGEILRKTLPVAAIYLILGGLMAWILTS